MAFKYCFEEIKQLPFSLAIISLNQSVLKVFEIIKMNGSLILFIFK
jgi:hypothetical protein